MTEKIIKVIKEKKILILLLTGIGAGILMVFGGTATAEKPKTNIEPSQNISNYTEMTESRLEELINKIDGINSATVMITLKSGSEYIYASDNSSTSESHVVVDEGLVYVKEYLPEIEGVAVVCKGGNSAIAKAKVTELICSLLGLPSTHVYVTE